jgi:hypothetical protein
VKTSLLALRFIGAAEKQRKRNERKIRFFGSPEARLARDDRFFVRLLA